MLNKSVIMEIVIEITTRPDYEMPSPKVEKLQRWLVNFYQEQGYDREEIISITNSLMEQILEESQVDRVTVDRRTGHYLRSHNELKDLILNFD